MVYTSFTVANILNIFSGGSPLHGHTVYTGGAAYIKHDGDSAQVQLTPRHCRKRE